VQEFIVPRAYISYSLWKWIHTTRWQERRSWTSGQSIGVGDGVRVRVQCGWPFGVRTWGQTLFWPAGLRGHKVPTKVDTLADPRWKTQAQSLTLTPTQRHSAESQVLHCICCRRIGSDHPQWWVVPREGQQTSGRNKDAQRGIIWIKLSCQEPLTVEPCLLTLPF